MSSTRYKIRSFGYANGHLSWHVYDSIEHYDIHTANTLMESSKAPICCKKICAALNYMEAAKRSDNKRIKQGLKPHAKRTS